MTIDELRDRRAKLQREIDTAIRSFFEDTDIIPEKVDIDIGKVELASGECYLSGVRTTVLAKV